MLAGKEGNAKRMESVLLSTNICIFYVEQSPPHCVAIDDNATPRRPSTIQCNDRFFCLPYDEMTNPKSNLTFI